MNLAVRDIRHNLGRFVFTTVGIGLLLMIVMGMGGIYRGLIFEATSARGSCRARISGWCKAARAARSPKSRAFPPTSKTECAPCRAWRERGASSRTPSSANISGRPLRMVVQGLSWPEDKGDWVPLVAGRPLRQAHYEMIADRSLGLPLGEKLKLGKDVYEVVGLTRGMVGTGGDGLCFFTVSDAMAIQFDVPGEAIAPGTRRARCPTRKPGPWPRDAAFVRARRRPGQRPARARHTASQRRAGDIAGTARMQLAWPRPSSTWPDVTVYSTQQQKNLLLAGMVDKAKRQLGLFRVLLIIISTIIMALIIYTLTLDKIHDIALLKLIGARNRVIIGLILPAGVAHGRVRLWAGVVAGPICVPALSAPRGD